MLPYFALLFIPAFLQICMKLWDIRFGHKNWGPLISGENNTLPIFFFLFLLLLAVRNQTVGRDLFNYKYIFTLNGQASFSHLFYPIQDCFFRLYCWVCYNFISQNFQVFIALTAILSVVPISYVYNQDKSHGYLKTVLFVYLPTFIILFSGIRQGLSMALGLLAYQSLKEKRLWRYFIWTFIALFIHHSGFMILFMLPLYHKHFSKTDLLWIIPGITTVFVFNSQIFNTISALMGNISTKYDVTAENNGAIGNLLLFILFAIFCYFVSDENQMDEEAFALRNMLTFSVVLQCFAPVYMSAMRINYYYIVLIPLALGKTLENPKPQCEQIAKVAEIAINIFFSAVFVYSTYHSYVTGISTLDTVPYIPFWRG